jgi:hypothetical protein
MQASQQLNKRKILCRASSRQRLLAGLVLSVVVISFGLLWLAASGKINVGILIDPCGFKQKYGLPCPTCGMTTSALAFVQGKILESFYIQPAAALLCCILVIVAFLAFLIAVFGVYFGFLNRFFTEVKTKHIILALLVIIAAGWAVTLARALRIDY